MTKSASREKGIFSKGIGGVMGLSESQPKKSANIISQGITRVGELLSLTCQDIDCAVIDCYLRA